MISELLSFDSDGDFDEEENDYDGLGYVEKKDATDLWHDKETMSDSQTKALVKQMIASMVSMLEDDDKTHPAIHSSATINLKNYLIDVSSFPVQAWQEAR